MYGQKIVDRYQKDNNSMVRANTTYYYKTNEIRKASNAPYNSAKISRFFLLVRRLIFFEFVIRRSALRVSVPVDEAGVYGGRDHHLSHWHWRELPYLHRSKRRAVQATPSVRPRERSESVRSH